MCVAPASAYGTAGSYVVLQHCIGSFCIVCDCRSKTKLRDAGASVTSKLQLNAILQPGPRPNSIHKKGDTSWYLCPDVSACQYGEHGEVGNTNCPSIGGTGSFVPSEGIGCSVGDGMSREWFWTTMDQFLAWGAELGQMS